MNITDLLLPTIEHFGFLSYWIIFFVFILESLAFIGILLPGTTLIVLLGFAAAAGIFKLGNLALFIIGGAVLGDMLSFYLGKKGKGLFNRDNSVFKLSYLEKGEAFFQKHGNKSVFLGRFLGPIRPVLSFVAGLFKMNFLTFFLWNAVSLLVWVSVFLFVGFFFGEAWQFIKMWMTRASLLVFAVILFLIIIYLIRRAAIKRGEEFLGFLKFLFVSLKQSAQNHFPCVYKFLIQRLNKNEFFGLPFTLLSLSFLYALLLFIGVVEDVLTSDSITLIDARLLDYLYSFRDSLLTKIFFVLTFLGKWWLIIILAAAFSLFLWAKKKKAFLIPLWITILGGDFFGFLSKLFFHRPRPELGVYFESSFSFPSGHALNAIAFYGFIIYFIWRQSGRWKVKINAFFSFLALILIIGFSRLYLGVHYLSDVWAGYLLGFLWLIIGISVNEWIIYGKIKQMNKGRG